MNPNIVNNFFESLSAIHISRICNENIPFEFILSNARDVLESHHRGSFDCNNLEQLESTEFFLDALKEKTWEDINKGLFSEVELCKRQTYFLSCAYKIALKLFNSAAQRNDLENCLNILDNALLIGETCGLQQESLSLASELNRVLNTCDEYTTKNAFPVIENIPFINYPCDIPIESCPAVNFFYKKYFKPREPVLLRNTISHWSAISKWKDISYLYATVGNRVAPVESGGNYASPDWSQSMIKLRGFLQRQFGHSYNEKVPVEYLAQHELLDQIPELSEDITVPDYCYLENADADVNIKVWIGPKGTVSQMHRDPTHNILCQVFGTKRIVLARPEDEISLYPHQNKFLDNTSLIDVENIDYNLYPLARKVQFYTLILQEGECVYIPPKWWHFVKSLNKSFSVSFWWK